MTEHIKGQDRHQVTLLPEALDDFVSEDNPVRVIDVFVNSLQLKTLGFKGVDAKLQRLTDFDHIVIVSKSINS
jgi:transposase